MYLQDPSKKIHTLPQLILSQMWSKDSVLGQYSAFKLHYLKGKMQRLQSQNLPAISYGGVYHLRPAGVSLLALWIHLGLCGKEHFDSFNDLDLLYRLKASDHSGCAHFPWYHPRVPFNFCGQIPISFKLTFRNSGGWWNVLSGCHFGRASF